MAYGEIQSGSDGMTEEDAEILAMTHRIFANHERGLTATEIAQLLNLQPSSVRIYLRNNQRRIDLYQRLFVEDETVKERAIRILETRRAE